VTPTGLFVLHVEAVKLQFGAKIFNAPKKTSAPAS